MDSRTRRRAPLTPAQQKLAADNTDLADKLAWMHCSPSVDWEEIRSDALLGLVHAAGDYDASRGVEFRAFAYHRIRGAIRDGYRGRDSLKRNDRKAVNKITQARSAFVVREGRSPHADELAREAGITTHQLARADLMQSRIAVPLPTPSADDGDVKGADVVEDPAALDELRRVDNEGSYDQLIQRIRNLSHRERITLWLHYWEGCTQAEVATILGVHESRVCQLLKQARDHLRGTLGPAGEELAA